MKRRKWSDRLLAWVLAGIAMLVFNAPPVLASSADSAIGSWKVYQHLPGNGAGFTNVAVNERWALVGSSLGSSPYRVDIYQLDPVTGKWIGRSSLKNLPKQQYQINRPPKLAMNDEWALVAGESTFGAYRLKQGQWQFVKLFKVPVRSIETVVMNDEWAFLGAAGAVYVFHLENEEWIITNRITPRSSTIENYSGFGTKLSISDEWLLIGGNFFDSPVVYHLENGHWEYAQALPGKLSGYPNAISDEWAFVGRQRGGLAVFNLENGHWKPVDTLSSGEAYAPTSQMGIDGEWVVVQKGIPTFSSQIIDFYHLENGRWRAVPTVESKFINSSVAIRGSWVFSGAGGPSADIFHLEKDVAISPAMPSDIPGGAATATLTDAARFAWQEFIALNWPNKSLNDPEFKRETADASAVFGSSTSSSLDEPLVWETLRNKVEIFPVKGSELYDQGISAFPYYDALPDYAKEYSESIPACSSTPSQDAWVNLDESNEIGEANMFAGVLPTAGPVDPEGGQSEKTPGAYPNQQFLYLAKANRAEYDYVKDRQWNLGGTSFGTSKTETATYITEDKRYEYPSLDETFTKGGKTYYYVSLPKGTDDTYGDVGTIELKSGWRQIKSDEKGKFHTTPVRYYTHKSEQDKTPCYEQPDADKWGMAALHIIHKTPSAPYFIFATFSQADNILTADGRSVENADGGYNGTPPATATTPNIKADTPGTPPAGTVYETPATKTQSEQMFSYDSSSLKPKVHQSTDKRLYYVNDTDFVKKYSHNTPGQPPEPPKTPIAVDKRQNDIPPEVIAVNQEAHEAICAYSKQYGLVDALGNCKSPWLHYKLVNVQWIPSTKAIPGPLYVKDPSKGQDLDPSTYYLANEVVETDFNLQFFSGRFASDFTRITDFATDENKEQYLNVFHAGKGFNMGGCAGCHGNAANKGADFSFILSNAGYETNPEEIGNAKAEKERVRRILEDIVPVAAK